MANWFAIYRLSDGSLISDESDEAAQRATDQQLSANGLGRVAVSQRPDKTHIWNQTTHQLDTVIKTDPAKDRAVALISKGEGNLSQQDRDALLIYLVKRLL